MNDDSKIACCLICTIADALKVCSECPFSIGLALRTVKQNEQLSAESLCRIDEIRERFVTAVTANS